MIENQEEISIVLQGADLVILEIDLMVVEENLAVDSKEDIDNQLGDIVIKQRHIINSILSVWACSFYRLLSFIFHGRHLFNHYKSIWTFRSFTCDFFILLNNTFSF